MEKERVIKFIERHQGKIIGSFIGLILAIVILVIGFFRTLFITLFICGGFYLGKRIDNRESISELLDRILPPGKSK